MASWIESRILVLEQRVEKLLRDMSSLLPSVRAAQQQLNQGGSVPQQTNGAGASVFFANHLNLAAATGTFPSITPQVTTAAVYKANGGVLILVDASATVENYLPDPTDNTKRQILGKNADNSYSVISQSCSPG